MKKLFGMFWCVIVIISLSGCSTMGSASNTTQNNTQGRNVQSNSNSLDFIKNGEYAFYLDNRYADQYYRGYLKLDTLEQISIFLVRNINASTGIETKFIFFIKDDENGYPTQIVNINGQFSGNEIRQALIDFLNFTTLYLRTQNDYENQKYIEEDWGGAPLIFSFNKELPLFKFNEVRLKTDNSLKYSFLFGDILSEANIGIFDSMDPSKR